MGVTPSLDGTGLTVRRSEDVRENIVEDIQGSSKFGTNAQTGADKVLGQIIDPIADAIGQSDELLQAAYDAWDPDAAEGVQLDNRGALVGVPREPATPSTATLTLGGTPATVIPIGSRARVPGGAIFVIDAEATIEGGGTVDASATCTATGPSEAASGSITEIVDSVVGWDTVTNAADAAIGTAIETDSAYRARIDQSLSAGGTSTDQALKAALRALPDVTAANVLSNRELGTDSNGTPGKSFLTVLWPNSGLNEERIAETIWDHLATGIKSHGADVEATITDSQGEEQKVRWSYGTQVSIWWEIDVTKKTGYPATGDQLVEDAVLAYGQSLSLGDDIEPAHAGRLIIDPSMNDYYVPGVRHLVIRVGKTVSPSGTVPVAMTATEVSAHASARVTVTST